MPDHLGYRIGGGVLVGIVVALNGINAGLLLAGPDSEGFEALGAAIAGFLWGAAFGVACGILFGFVRPPPRRLHRWVVLAAGVVAVILSLALQESLD